MISYWSLCDSKSPQVSRILLSILADLCYVVVWMVSICPLTSESSRPHANPLVTVPRTPFTFGIIVLFMFHSFFSSLATSCYLSFFSISFILIAKSINWQDLIFFFIITCSSRLDKFRWSVCISKFERSLCVSFSMTDSGLCIYHVFA